MFSWLKNNSAHLDRNGLSKAVIADLNRNVRALDDIPREHFTAICEVAARSVAGRALNTLSTELTKIEGMSARRAGDIALLLANKAGVAISNEQRLALGIEEARWRHSGAPCRTADLAHKAANGQTYSIKKGMLIEGARTWPGHAEGCKCSSQPIIPGFEE